MAPIMMNEQSIANRIKPAEPLLRPSHIKSPMRAPAIQTKLSVAFVLIGEGANGQGERREPAATVAPTINELNGLLPSALRCCYALGWAEGLAQTRCAATTGDLAGAR